MDDYEAIRRLIAIYSQLLDSGRYEEWGGLFLEDAIFSVGVERYVGRSEIVREIGGMQPADPSKHLALQPVIDLDGADGAEVWTDFAVVITAGGQLSVVTIGRYHDRLARHEGRWHFAARTIVMGGESPPADIPPVPAR